MNIINDKIMSKQDNNLNQITKVFQGENTTT